MNFIDFILRLKHCYNLATKEQHDAKEVISVANDMHKNLLYVINTIEDISKKLFDIYLYIDINSRKNMVQPLLDVFQYNSPNFYSSNYGLITRYKSFENDFKNYICDMETSYKNHNFKDVMKYYGELMEMCEEFKEKANIRNSNFLKE